MDCISHYRSPLGQVLLAADDTGLTGLWFEGQAHFARGLSPHAVQRDLPVFDAARRWLDAYFAGQQPAGPVLLHLTGTEFQRQVWSLLRAIPYGQTCTYGDLARQLTALRGKGTSARAVGGAVGRNPISLLVPCHRVVGSGGSLTGYAGGLERKTALLRLEGASLAGLHCPGL